ncbi:sugar transferase [Gracilimonas sp.]|uniref:sugar transferase n=1 Tax=Gracilimonas sp. TaxID=1974203 RepID=UPI0032F00F46
MELSEKTLKISRVGTKQKGVNEFIKSLNLGIDSSQLEWFDSTDKDKIPNASNSYSGIANIQPINDIQRINKFFEEANHRLEKGKYFLTAVETKDTRKNKILNNYPKFIGYPVYVLDFILKRVLPKISFTKGLYFWFTNGKSRVLSLTESLGRLTSCGFDIIGYQRIGYTTYILSQKQSDPAYDMQPTYGALVKLNRIGKGGELFSVYKLRTMHPYSEYLQDYAFKKNSLQQGGKIKDDFRVTTWGRWFRKLWIDELPMFINFFKREMKLVGVRPLSRHYFNLYPEDLQELRTKVKPGLVPPFYADMPQTLEEIIESERKYLKSYLEHPIRTDVRYFFKAWYNILVKKARSN